MDLSNQVAIISGGLGDIGRAIAFELAGHGADIAIGDILPAKKAEETLAQLRKMGHKARYDRVDVSDDKAVARWVANVEKSLGLVTLIIPNAAIVHALYIRKVRAQQWNKELSVNLSGAFYLAQTAALRLLAKKKPGRIVFIGSWAGHVPHKHIPTYCVSKAGLRMLCQQMAVDFAPDDILVNEVAPGYVDAGLSGKSFRKDAALKRACEERVPIKRMMSAEEVAYEVAHLCDPKNRHMTGSVLLMDGGLSLRTP